MTPRYASRPLPATAYVPGRTPRTERPAADPIHGSTDYRALATDEAFRYGIDLFNHGFPWEAHEAWEPLWFAAPRDRPERALLQGLIHAAAAVVKARAGAHAPARGFVESACAYLALGATPIVEVRALIAALTSWAHDPTQPPPTITLA